MDSELISSVKERLEREFEKDEPDLSVIEKDLAEFVSALKLDSATDEMVELITAELNWLQGSIKLIEKRKLKTFDELKELANSKKNIKHYQNP